MYIYIYICVRVYICPCVFYCLYYCMEKIMIDMIDRYDDICLHTVNIDHYRYMCTNLIDLQTLIAFIIHRHINCHRALNISNSFL